MVVVVVVLGGIVESSGGRAYVRYGGSCGFDGGDGGFEVQNDSLL